MKKILFTLSVLLATATIVSAQTLDTERLYQKYKGEKGVVSIYVPGFVMRLAGQIADLEKEERELLRCMRSVRILTIEDTERYPGVNFAEEVQIRPGQNGYIPMLSVSDKGEDVKIFARERNGMIRELLILVGGEDNVMVHLKGRINKDMMSSLVRLSGGSSMEHLIQL